MNNSKFHITYYTILNKSNLNMESVWNSPFKTLLQSFIAVVKFDPVFFVQFHFIELLDFALLQHFAVLSNFFNIIIIFAIPP